MAKAIFFFFYQNMHKAEYVAHAMLGSATAYHEWGNIVGWSCLPIIAVALIHIFWSEA